MNHPLLCLALVLVFCGCRTLETDSPHLLAIDPEGRLFGTRDPSPCGNACEQHLDTIFNGILEQRERGLTNILLFVQGGLNDIESGVERAHTLSPAILSDRARPAYPIFVAWDASFSATYNDYLFRIRRGRKDPYAHFTWPFYLAADLGRVTTRAPISLSLQGESDLKAIFMNQTRYQIGGEPNGWYAFNPRIKEANRAAAQVARTRPNLSLELSGDLEKPSTKIINGFTYLGTLPMKVALTPFVDTAGKNAWDKMIRRTHTLFVTPGAFEKAALSIFLARLESFCAAYPELRITLAGHSMGAIVCCEILRRHPNLPIDHIVFMAAACGIDEFDSAVLPRLRRPIAGESPRFYNLMLHPFNDARETHYKFGEIVPRGSLLDWIDNFYSSTETDFGRTLGKWENIVLALAGDAIDRDVDELITMKAFGMGDAETVGPQAHGSFDNYKFWDPAFWQTTAQTNTAPALQRALPAPLRK